MVPEIEHAACITVFDLGGNSCVIPVGFTCTVADIKQRARNELNIDGERIVLLHRSSELRESEPLPSGDLSLLLLNRPRPENWDALIEEFCDAVAKVEPSRQFQDPHEFIYKVNSQLQHILEDFGIEFAKEAITRSKEMIFRFLPLSLQAERSIVLHAVRKDYNALQFAPAHFRSDRAVVLAAVRQNMIGCPCCDPYPINLASEELRNDPDIVFTAMQAEPDSVYAAQGDEWKTFRRWIFDWDMYSPDVLADSAVGHLEALADKHANKKNRKSSSKVRCKDEVTDFEWHLKQPRAADNARRSCTRRRAKRLRSTFRSCDFHRSRVQGEKQRELRHKRWSKHVAADQAWEQN